MKHEIEIYYKKDNNPIDYLSFPEVGLLNLSIQIDYPYIECLDEQIEWAKKHNVEYSNIDEIRIACNELLIDKWGETKPMLQEEKPIKKEKKKKIKPIKSQKLYVEINKNKTYLMKDNHNNLYKIGYSKKPNLREKTLQSEKPSIKMVKVWDCDIEKKLHKLYDEFRVRGEWFNLSKIQVRYICTHF